jgi:hypothetical protein
MIRRFTATALSLLLLFAATISLNDELEPVELFSSLAPEQMELSFGGSDDPVLPDYPDAISQRLLRKRVSARALIGERTANVISISSICNIVQSSICHRTSPQDLYQHQTSLRI